MDPTAPELAHNVRKVLAECGLKRLNLSPDVESSFSALYGDLPKASEITEEKSSHGWRYMPPIVAKNDVSDGPNDSSADPKDDPVPSNGNKNAPNQKKSLPKHKVQPDRSVILSGGTGFVVSPHYILTNQHVIADGPNIYVCDPADSTGNTQLKAKIIAQSRNPDLAIIKCNEINAPPIGMCDHLPGRGTDIMVLGFPEFFQIGTGLKSTRGSIVGLPSDDTDGMCLYDAITNHGNSGGPICDSTGRVVGVVRVIFNLTEKLAGGIPCEQAVAFVQKHVPDFHPVEESSPVVSWTDVDALASKSTVLVVCRGERDSSMTIPGRDESEFQSSSKSSAAKTGKRQSGSVKSEPTYIEDDCCLACKGAGKVRCPDCQNGTVGKTERVSTYTDPGTGVELYADKKIRVPCKTCNGTGQVACPVCSGSGVER